MFGKVLPRGSLVIVQMDKSQKPKEKHESQAIPEVSGMESFANAKNKSISMGKSFFKKNIVECTLEEPYEGKLQVRFREGCLSLN